MFQYLCVTVVYVGYLLCCIIVVHFLYAGFGGFSAGEADKIGYFLKKILYSSIMFIDCLRNVSSVMFFGIT
jgi:hypothetical protein